jgi:NAD(P)H-hydrate epimerase
VLIVGGDEGMAGAAQLAGEAAARVGAGLVTVATHPTHAGYVSAARPELLIEGVKSSSALKRLCGRATVIAVGPGLGRKKWGCDMLAAALESTLPLVVDADGLNLLAAHPDRRDDWILTPHPGEAARLLHCTNTEIQNDRFAAVREIAKRYGGICVLKGAGTLIAGAAPGPVGLCDRGNPGMASGGMGDVLTGVIAGLSAQGLAPMQAASLGVWLHASAGDDAAREAGEAGLLASDLLPGLRGRLNAIMGNNV